MQKELPPIPPKRYFTIGEVADLCLVKPYVLRYWEQEFTQLKPVKRRGNRRYYQHHEVLLIRRIRNLLYEQGFTINGARNKLSDGGAALHDPDPGLVELEADDLAGNGAELSNGARLAGPAVADDAGDASGELATAVAASAKTFAAQGPLDARALRSELESIRRLLEP
jgi:DNA-binding transcriptional MerR regulator